MKRIIYAQNDGTIAVIIPANECGLTIEQIAAKDVPAGKSFEIIEHTELPPRDEYRNSWVLVGSKIVHDMTKAREIKRERIRVERKPLLENLDAEFMRALENSDKAKQAEIVARKQKLRDAPADPRIEKAKTVDDLKAIKLRS